MAAVRPVDSVPARAGWLARVDMMTMDSKWTKERYSSSSFFFFEKKKIKLLILYIYLCVCVYVFVIGFFLLLLFWFVNLMFF